MPTSNISYSPTVEASGFYFGVNQEQLKDSFDPKYPYSYCRICGWVYQPPAQRRMVPVPLQLRDAPFDSIKKQDQRKRASQRHSNCHTPAEKEAVGANGFTPEATYRLAAFGIANPTEIALSKHHDKAHEQAGLESPIPGFWLPDDNPAKIHK